MEFQNKYFVNQVFSLFIFNKIVFIFLIYMTALYIACCEGNTKLINYLLKLPDIDVNKRSILLVFY